MDIIRLPYYHPVITALGLMLIAAVSYIAYRRAQKRAGVKKYLIGSIICILLSVVTTSKLYTMYQIRGIIPGASTLRARVTQKWHETFWDTTTERTQHTYWISWTDQDIQQPGPHRINVLEEKWAGLKAGDPIELIYVPGESRPLLRNDIFESDGQFIFDYVLLLAELAGAVWLTLKMLRTGKSDAIKRQDSDTIRLFE